MQPEGPSKDSYLPGYFRGNLGHSRRMLINNRPSLIDNDYKNILKTTESGLPAS